MTFFYGKRKEPMEIWKEIKGTDFKYEISTYGRCRGYHNTAGKVVEYPLIKSLTNTGNGYLQTKMTIGGKGVTKKIHRLVAETFIPNPENKPEVNHIDGVKTNNHIDNLEWVTRSENVKHAFATGLNKGRKGKKIKPSIKKEKKEKYKRKVILNDVEYNSILECMEQTNRSTTYIYKHGFFKEMG